MLLQQLGAPLPPQRIMEYAVKLLDEATEGDSLSYARGVAEMMAILSLTGEFDGPKPTAADRRSGNLPGRKG